MRVLLKIDRRKSTHGTTVIRMRKSSPITFLCLSRIRMDLDWWMWKMRPAAIAYTKQKISSCTNSENLKQCYDVSSVWAWAEYCYEVNTAMKMYKVCFGFGTWGTDLYYSDHCSFSENLFLCIWLKNASYCILNKQYTKEEYESLVPRIIEKMISLGEWWEFFPSSLSPFGYNETVAQEYYPLSRDSVIPAKAGIQKQEVLDSGINPEWQKIQTFLQWPIFNWSDDEAPFPSVSKVIPASKLPDTIEGIPDDILNWAIECEVSWKPFRIIKQELEFYRKHNLPIPKRHPDVRHMDRMKMRNPRKLFERKCDKCEKDMITTYAPYEIKWSIEVPLGCAPERSEKVYCEECYNREVIS